MDIYSRTGLLIGEENLLKLKNSRVAIFGVGGVGSFVAEALARAAVSNITLIDNDIVSVTNINRQLIALHSTIGKNKVLVMKDRILDINNDINVDTYNIFIDENTINQIDFTKFDYIIDAIDTITSKVLIISKAQNNKVMCISCMGMGNKLDPTKLRIDDIFKTSVCPLAKIMRKLLKEKGIQHQNVIFSTEIPVKIQNIHKEDNVSKRSIPGSISYVPSTAGLWIAYKVINDIIGEEDFLCD